MLAGIAYVPLLMTQPGVVGADTKSYLYLDPSRLLSRAVSMWDPNVGLGTVTHQNIGFLFPTGPFYWVFEQLSVPDWVAQRIWLGSILFAAGMGVRYLLRTLGWRGTGIIVASLAYMLSPYLLDYSARLSVILLPWAALPWLIALTSRALHTGGWRYPAAFALVILAVGGNNAPALTFIALGPLLFVLYATFVEREPTVREATAAVGRIGLLSLLVSMWWIGGLAIQGQYGISILRYTETYEVVADSSVWSEVLRGLGYWFFYGNDKLGAWVEPSNEYTSRTLLLALTFLLPILAFAAAALIRWRSRAYFVLLIVVGTVLAVGAHPFDDPSVVGRFFKEFTGSDIGLGLRSTPRAVPLIALGTAVLLGAGVAAIGRAVPKAAVPAAALVGVLVVANLPPLWNGTMVAEGLQRPEDIPEYWVEAAAYLDARDDGTRVLEVPGTDFAAYRWGNTIDPVTPGLMDRPFVARELVPYGSPESAALLTAFDRRFQEGTMEPTAIAPVARLMGVGDIVLRADLQYERFRTARPKEMWDLLMRAPGLGEPTGFGEPVPNVAGPEQPLLDEATLAQAPDLEDPTPVAVFPVEDAQTIVRAETPDRPLLVSGDADGVVDAAGAGLLEVGQPLFFTASLLDDPETWEAVVDAGANVLLTDTNRRRSLRWGSVYQNAGYTERAGEVVTAERLISGFPLDVFPGADDDLFTVTEQRGGAVVSASDYGNRVLYTPENRPAIATSGR